MVKWEAIGANIHSSDGRIISIPLKNPEEENICDFDEVYRIAKWIAICLNNREYLINHG